MFLPLELSLRPSRIYLAVLALAHGLALLGIWLAALPAWVQGGMTVALLASAMRSRREISGGPRGLRVTQSGLVEVLDGEWRGARISGRPVALPWFAGVTLAIEGGTKRRLVLLPDSAEADGFRKLRVWLKWAAPGT